MPKYRVTIRGKNYAAMADLVLKHRLNIAGHSAKALARGAYRVDAHADSSQIRALERAGYTVRRREDVDKAGKERQTENARRARAAPAGPPPPVADANRYLTVDEIVQSLFAAAAPPNDGFTKLIALPHKTWEQRDCHALKIAHGDGAGRPGIYFLGGVHAREWGSPDILINFVQQLTAAYRTGKGITIGTKTFPAAQIQHIVNDKTVYVFPQANPDGRHHSMTSDPDWRKNRRPAPPGKTSPNCIGVDLNRNFDFLWNFPKYFSPLAPVRNS